jgi:hypothetical protein
MPFVLCSSVSAFVALLGLKWSLSSVPVCLDLGKGRRITQKRIPDVGYDMLTAGGSTKRGEEPQCHTRQVETEKIKNEKKKIQRERGDHRK